MGVTFRQSSERGGGNSSGHAGEHGKLMCRRKSQGTLVSKAVGELLVCSKDFTQNSAHGVLPLLFGSVGVDLMNGDIPMFCG